MLSLLLYGVLALMLVAVFVWAWHRSKSLGAESSQREAELLAQFHAGKDSFAKDKESARNPQADADTSEGGESVFAGIPSEAVPLGNIDVADVTEAVDIDRLLAGEPLAVMTRARARLEEPTNMVLDGDTLPPRPLAPPPPPPAPPPPPPPPIPKGDSWAARAAANTLGRNTAAALETAREQEQEREQQRRAEQLQADLRQAERLEAQRMQAERAQAEQRFEQQRLAALQAQQVALAQRQSSLARQRVLEAERVAAPRIDTSQTPDRALPLRELTLAWFEARGYRSAPASVALRPIELVLRHKSDPARIYGFVVEDSFVTLERIRALREQAKSVGLMRVLIVANVGADPQSFEALRKKGVRVMDRAAVEQEFKTLDFSVAAKIIAVARKRSALVQSAQ